MSLVIRDLAEAARTPHEPPHWLVVITLDLYSSTAEGLMD